MHALVLAPFSESQLNVLAERLDVTYESWHETSVLYAPEELGARLAREGTALLVLEGDFVFEEVFEAAPDLRLVGICRNSTNQVDVASATAHGVVVVNTPGRNTRAVAEHALALMLALARRIPESHDYVTRGNWRNPAGAYISLRGVELGGRTLGIVGLGAIGGTLAKLAGPIGMNVIAFDPYVESAPPGVRMAALDEVMAYSDFVSLHLPLTPETEGMLDADRLSLMKTGAYLVNLSDSAIVSETALVAALEKGRIAGAALDVFPTHPVDPNNPLLRLPNVIATPHLGGATAETIERHSAAMADDILRFLDGERPRNLVNNTVWESRG